MFNRILDAIVYPLVWLAHKGPRISKYYETSEDGYFKFELPEDSDCDDVENKRKWEFNYKDKK